MLYHEVFLLFEGLEIEEVRDHFVVEVLGVCARVLSHSLFKLFFYVTGKRIFDLCLQLILEKGRISGRIFAVASSL